MLEAPSLHNLQSAPLLVFGLWMGTCGDFEVIVRSFCSLETPTV